MISPSATSPSTMEDQVKREFAVTNKLKPILCPIYPSSSSNPAFSDPAPTPTSAGGSRGSPNFSNESAPPVTYEFGGQSENYEQTDEFINYANDEEEYNEEDYFNSFPPGYRFKPHDEELVVYYLKRKIYNQSLPRNRIKEVELYKYNPDTLAAKYNPNGEDEWYFFTPRDRKYPNGDRPNRAAGDGFWKATGADKPIRFNGTTVGLKKSLVFYRGKPPRGDKTDWIMHEYKLMDAPKRKKISQNDMKLDDWVLCKIRKKDKKDKSVKPTISELQSQSSDASPPPPSEKNIQMTSSSCTAVISNIPTPAPMITGRNEDSNFGYSHNYNGYSESLRPFENDQASVYAQNMNFAIAGHNNSVAWIDNMASPMLSPMMTFYHSMQTTPYDYLLHPPQLQQLDNSFPNDFDPLLYSSAEEKDINNNMF